MAELDLLTEIHTDVKYIKEKLSDHIIEDEKRQDKEELIKENILYPLWDAHQQRRGAIHLGGLICSIVGSTVTVVAMLLAGMIHK